MRDLALTGVIAVLLVLALRHTWIGALLWTWLSLMNPHKQTYSFAYDAPYAAITAGVTLLSILWSRGKVRLPMDPCVVVLMLFVAWMGVTTAFAVNPAISAVFLERAVKVQIMTLVCIAAIRERKHIELFVWVNFLSIGFYGIKGGLFAIATAGSSRVWGPADSFIADNNAIGLALVMILPLGYFLFQVTVHRWVRRGLLLSLILIAVAALSTQSRGAFLAITMMALLLWTRMERKVVPGIAIVIIGALLLGFMPESWEARMRTIGEYQQDDSAMQRLNAWTTAVRVAGDRITGAGFYIASSEVFSRYSPNPDWVFTAHSIYFQALGEQGWPGLMLFVSMGALCFVYAARLRSEARSHAEAMWVHDLAGAIQVSMIGYAVGGAFLSLAYWDLPYNFMVMLIACKYWMREKRWQHEKVGPFGSTSGRQVRLQRVTARAASATARQ